MRRVAILALAAASCSLVDTPIVGLAPDGFGVPDAGPDGPDRSGDAGLDGAVCEVDRDEDGSCAGVDCDDGNPRRTPGRLEYCPDRTDNDCDDNVDFADECGVLNDSCDGALAILRQEEDRNETFWQFDLPLDHYRDDAVAGLSAGGGNCLATAGQNGRDAVFELVATADSSIDATATGSMGAVPVLVLRRSACAQGAADDVCDTADAGPAHVVAAVDQDASAWLIVDDDAATLAGAVQLEVRITRRVPH